MFSLVGSNAATEFKTAPMTVPTVGPHISLELGSAASITGSMALVIVYLQVQWVGWLSPQTQSLQPGPSLALH